MRVIRPASLEAAKPCWPSRAHARPRGRPRCKVEWAQGKPRPAVMGRSEGLLPACVTRGNGTVTPRRGHELQAIQRAGLPLLSEATADVAAPACGGSAPWAAPPPGAPVASSGAARPRAEAETTAGPQPLRRISPHTAAFSCTALPGPAPTPRWCGANRLPGAFSPAVIVAAGVRDGARLRSPSAEAPSGRRCCPGRGGAGGGKATPRSGSGRSRPPSTLRPARSAAPTTGGAPRHARSSTVLRHAARTVSARPRPVAPPAVPSLRRLSGEIAARAGTSARYGRQDRGTGGLSHRRTPGGDAGRPHPRAPPIHTPASSRWTTSAAEALPGCAPS